MDDELAGKPLQAYNKSSRSLAPISYTLTLKLTSDIALTLFIAFAVILAPVLTFALIFSTLVYRYTNKNL